MRYQGCFNVVHRAIKNSRFSLEVNNREHKFSQKQILEEQKYLQSLCSPILLDNLFGDRFSISQFCHPVSQNRLMAFLENNILYPYRPT